MNLKLTLLVTLLLLITLTASAQTKTTSVSNTLIQLEQLSSNLTYTSETDSTVSNHLSPLTANILTTEEFLRVNLLPVDTIITEVDADQWFSRQASFNPLWLTLQSYMGGKFNNVVVYRVGTIQVLYYAVGLYKNRIIGVRSYAIET